MSILKKSNSMIKPTHLYSSCPAYALNSTASTLVRYVIDNEYITEKFLKYVVVKDEDFNKEINSSTAYGYGILSNIHHTNFIVIDVDDINTKFSYNNKEYFCENRSNALLVFCKLLQIEYPQITNINVLSSSMTKVNSPGYSRYELHYGIHIYAQLDNYYNVEQVYKSYLVNQIICPGYLKFLTYNGHSNIRISQKFNIGKLKKKFYYGTLDTHSDFITPLFSLKGSEIIKYTEFEKIELYEKEKLHENVSNRSRWDRVIPH